MVDFFPQTKQYLSKVCVTGFMRYKKLLALRQSTMRSGVSQYVRESL